jgi:hypothetical protein
VKVFLSIKYHPNQRNREHIEAVSAALEKIGYQTLCVARDVERWGQVRLSPQELMARTFEAIDACEVLLVDLTEKGVGLGIETGYAHARGIPVLVIARHGSDIPRTLQGMAQRVFWYQSPDDLKDLDKPPDPSFQPGDKVIWWKRIEGTQYVYPVKATVLEVTAQRVKIEADDDGHVVIRYVKPESLGRHG